MLTFDTRPITCDGGAFAFIPVTKNGCTLLKRLVLNCDWPEVEVPKGKVHDEFTWDSPARVDFEDVPKHYIKFAVWRNPIDRARSLYTNKWILNKSCVHSRKDDSIETFIEWLRYRDKEEHFSHQHIWLIDNIVKLDHYVNIEDLDDFIINVLGLEPADERNESQSDFYFNEEQEKQIRAIYDIDFYLEAFVNYAP